jgi:FixJ family two-component response regulator
MIAIVEDDESVREATVSLFRSAGFSPAAFACPAEFLDAEHGAFECLVADVNMPGMTGIELHNRLVAAGQPIPTVLITAYPDEPGRQRALKAGVCSYLVKPFNEQELLDCVQSALEPENSRSQTS